MDRDFLMWWTHVLIIYNFINRVRQCGIQRFIKKICDFVVKTDKVSCFKILHGSIHPVVENFLIHVDLSLNWFFFYILGTWNEWFILLILGWLIAELNKLGCCRHQKVKFVSSGGRGHGVTFHTEKKPSTSTRIELAIMNLERRQAAK